MKKLNGTTMVAAGLSQTVNAAEPAAAAFVTVDPATEVGPVKPMNAVNNGPVAARSDQSRSNFSDFKALRVPFARTHDSINQATSNGHTVDISAVFPDFEADENDPASYDFAYTDAFLETIIAAGTKPFFRLGQTIENGIKKYHVFPPKDFAKWARVCEHVILHCNESWCDGHRWGIEYWEIWNEADAQPDELRHTSCQWQGTKAEFFEFYETVAKHLKGRFPNLKIGGPSLGWRMDWTEDFLKWQSGRGTPIDFFSWHCYERGFTNLKSKSREVRRLLDENGYPGAESILDEWNYIKDWTTDFPYSVRVIASNVGGAFTAAYMCEAQNSPIDMLMYYDARPATVFNGLFDFYTFSPLPAYYALFSWADLRELGTQVATEVATPSTNDNTVVTAVAAKGADDSLGVLVARYCDDRNVTASETFTLRLASGRFAGRVRGYVTDEDRLHSPVHLVAKDDGTVSFTLAPNAFIYIETRFSNQ
jgi:hypothetical protein